jgi:branched-chain amino acid transport system substrate-binding protein
MQQYRAVGLTLPLLGGEGMADDSLLRTFGDESVGLISSGPYSAKFDSPANRKFVAGMVRDTQNVPGTAGACLYINGMVAEEALKSAGGSTGDREAFIKALRVVSLTDSPRGAFHFDHFGNVVGNIFIRRCERKGDKLINTIVKTYPDVSQFWTYDEKWFLSRPVYSRDYPPLKV